MSAYAIDSAFACASVWLEEELWLKPQGSNIFRQISPEIKVEGRLRCHWCQVNGQSLDPSGVENPCLIAKVL
ncbi:MAG: hypothetical protein KME17_09855 [Cyanosarcina radialis HA8281-LM2]|nr:hypothetical protein [Cyanosarcina radialis HA8281-LM2]